MAGEILPDKLYTVEQVAELLGGIHRRTVWRLLRKGELKGRRIGRRWYVRGSDILAAGTEAEEPKSDKSGGLRLRKQEPPPKRAAKRKPPDKAEAKASGRGLVPRVIG